MRSDRKPVVLIRGGGELATGIACAMNRRGALVVVTDRPRPTALRLGVTFATAVLKGRMTVEGVRASHVNRREEIEAAWARGEVALWTAGERALDFAPPLLVDARMRQLSEAQTTIHDALVVIGIGPGFEAGVDADYVIESNRGPALGEIISTGRAEAHTGIPGDVLGFREERILRAPRAGKLVRVGDLGDFVAAGDIVARVGDDPVRARLDGMIRGLKLTGVDVGAGHKVGDIDPRRDRSLLSTMTDKARAIGLGAVRAAEIACIFQSDKGPRDLALPREKEGSPRCI